MVAAEANQKYIHLNKTKQNRVWAKKRRTTRQCCHAGCPVVTYGSKLFHADSVDEEIKAQNGDMTHFRSHSHAVVKPILTVQSLDSCARAFLLSLPISWVALDYWREHLSAITEADIGHFSETQGTFSYNFTWFLVYPTGHASCKGRRQLWRFLHSEFLYLMAYQEFPSVGVPSQYDLGTGCSSFQSFGQQDHSLGSKLLSKGF